MNWISKFIKPKIKSLFKKRTSENDETLWTTCECKNLIYKEDLESNFHCCPKCGVHHKISCKERFQIFFDDKQFEIIETPQPYDDTLSFSDKKKYVDRLKTARKLTNQNDAVAIAKGKIDGMDVTVGAQDFRFIGGSFGLHSAEAFISGVQHAINNKTPYLFFVSSGGIRLMESTMALTKGMAGTTLAINELKKQNLPYIVILTNPSVGGVAASFGMLGDFLIAEPKSIVGFAGKRVIKDTVREALPENFQEAESVKEFGAVDLVVERKYLRSTVSTLLKVLTKSYEKQSQANSNIQIDENLAEQISSKASSG